MAAGSSNGGSSVPMLPMHDKTPLSYLLEAAIHKTYHELHTMAEILPGKTNLERKKELVKFACRTRQLFIRLLAVVKWAGTAGKVNACENIQNVLERRVRLVRDTSDALAHIAREKLINIRLPNYPITDAVDTLSLGSVNFLPEKISEATTPFIPASDVERQEILPRLQQILTARVAIAELPIQFSTVNIRNGIVTLAVDGEFEVKLSVKSDNLFAPWHIYKTKLFLRDPEEPEQELIHPAQMQLITTSIQSWLNDCENPLVELYRYLHYYCQSLRLQILFEQACRIRNRSSKQKHLHISNYISCKSFNIEYWKESHLNHLQKKSMNNEKSRDICMTIQCDDEGKFQIIHWPPLPVEDSVAILQLLDKPTFTMEEILNRTISARCQRRFEELKEKILSVTSGNIVIDPTIPSLKCELLPESSPEEILFISISPFSGLYKVVSYMENRFSQQIEHALNRDQNNLTEAINLFKIWLIQQRIPSLLSHVNCRVYTRIPTLNPKNDLIAPFINNSSFIELIHNEGYFLLVHVADVDQLLLQYYLLIIEKRSSIHEPIVLQQQNLSHQQQGISANDEYAKWILEPLVICALDPTAYLRRELIEFKNVVHVDKSKEFVTLSNGVRQARSTSVLSLKLLLKLVNYYDEMLTFTFLKEEFQRKRTICKGITYGPWTGIPQLDIVRTSTGDESFQSNIELSSYVNECFWPRLVSSTIRLTYVLRETTHLCKHSERHWTLQLQFPDSDYFRYALIKTPLNVMFTCNQISAKFYPKIVDFLHNELRSAFELTYLFENYALALIDSNDLRAITEVNSFSFFKCSILYGPNFTFNVTLSPGTISNNIDSHSVATNLFDLGFTTTNAKFLSTAHQLLNNKLILFLNRTRSLKQFLRLLHMTSMPIAAIARMNCFNRPVVFVNQGACAQPLLTFVPYTECRWRLIFAQVFALDIQICGPNLILVRDGAFSVQLNSGLNELYPIPRLKDFLVKYADDRGLTYEFTHITDRFRDRDFLLPELQLPPSSVSSAATPNPTPFCRTLTTANTPTPHLLHPVGTPASTFNPMTPASVGPSSQAQQQVHSPSQSAVSPGSSMLVHSPMTAITGSPMTGNTINTQLTGPSSVGIPMQSPGPAFDMQTNSPLTRASGSTFPSSLLGPSPGTPANVTLTSAPTPLNARSDEYNTKVTSSLHSYNRSLPSKPHYPVYMSQQTFFRMIYTPDGHQWSKLEFFLAASLLVKHFSRAASEPSDPNNPTVRSSTNESDTYRIENLFLQLAFLFDPQTSIYRLQLTPLIDGNSQQTTNFMWQHDEINLFEKFLNDTFFPTVHETNQSMMPSIDILSLGVMSGRPTLVGALEKMLSMSPPKLLRDLIKIIRLEQNPENSHQWRVRWCLTYPQGAMMGQMGQVAIHIGNGICGYTFQFIPRTNRNDLSMMGNSSFQHASTPIVFVLSYDPNSNITTMPERLIRSTGGGVNEYRVQNIVKILSNSRETTMKYECSLYPMIHELASCLPIQTTPIYSQ